MNFKELVERVEGCDAFKNLKGEQVLVHFFKMGPYWELGYAGKDGKVTVFECGDSVKASPSQETVSGKPLLPLSLERVKVLPEELDSLVRDASGVGEEEVSQRIILLQNHEGEHVYNVTLITKNLQLVKVSLSAETGKALSSEKKSLLSLGTG